MHELIDYSQIAYIKYRYIMDNMICAHEILHQVKISKIKGVLFKIDFEKIFDRVHWDFLLETLKGIFYWRLSKEDDLILNGLNGLLTF
jgi:hypothetical protein